MATLVDLTNLIEEAFPGADVSGLAQDQNRVGGIIRWNGFADLSIEDRNQLVTQKVRDKLGLRGLNVGTLMPLAPKEML